MQQSSETLMRCHRQHQFIFRRSPNTVNHIAEQQRMAT